MRYFFYFAVLMFMFTISAVSQTKVYTAADTVITASVGEQFDIKLASNQSTGYSWHVENNFGSLVFIKGKDYITPETSKVGEGGDELWHFEALATGDAKLIFFYSRSLDRADGDNILTFTINIK